MRKHGAGKHNWGTYQDDQKFHIFIAIRFEEGEFPNEENQKELFSTD